MAKQNVRRCQNCQGNGQIYTEVKPGKWEWKTCSACNGSGVIIMPNI